MRRSKEWWARLRKEERRSLVLIERTGWWKVVWKVAEEYNALIAKANGHTKEKEHE